MGATSSPWQLAELRTPSKVRIQETSAAISVDPLRKSVRIVQRAAMPRYLYAAWFRDTAADREDQDYEWVACIEIVGETAESARDWGDTLARRRTQGTPDVFLSSKVEPNVLADQLPLVRVGELVEDSHIGW